jgi:hypothetical protein
MEHLINYWPYALAVTALLILARRLRGITIRLWFDRETKSK